MTDYFDDPTYRNKILHDFENNEDLLEFEEFVDEELPLDLLKDF